MAWIRTIPPAEATGRLRRIYEAAIARVGKVFQILRIQSLRPDTLDAAMQLYLSVMQSRRSPLSRVQREMIAVAVSSHNACHY